MHAATVEDNALIGIGAILLEGSKARQPTSLAHIVHRMSSHASESAETLLAPLTCESRCTLLYARYCTRVQRYLPRAQIMLHEKSCSWALLATGVTETLTRFIDSIG
jgi:hypothetical protein